MAVSTPSPSPTPGDSTAFVAGRVETARLEIVDGTPRAAELALREVAFAGDATRPASSGIALDLGWDGRRIEGLLSGGQVGPLQLESGRLLWRDPGGAPGRDKLDYAFIAVVLSAEAVCREDDNDNIVADVTITYAVEPGPLYQGVADVQLFASATEAGDISDRQVTASKSSRLAKDSGPVTLTVTAAGLVLGDEDTVEAGGIGIAAGFVKQAVQP